MHNLAIALKEKGYEVSGPYDEIFEPSYSRLKPHGLLPPVTGWDAGKIHEGLDAVIVWNACTRQQSGIGKGAASWPENIFLP
jgi:hypothetical protein